MVLTAEDAARLINTVRAYMMDPGLTSDQHREMRRQALKKLEENMPEEYENFLKVLTLDDVFVLKDEYLLKLLMTYHTFKENPPCGIPLPNQGIRSLPWLLTLPNNADTERMRERFGLPARRDTSTTTAAWQQNASPSDQQFWLFFKYSYGADYPHLDFVEEHVLHHRAVKPSIKTWWDRFGNRDYWVCFGVFLFVLIASMAVAHCSWAAGVRLSETNNTISDASAPLGNKSFSSLQQSQHMDAVPATSHATKHQGVEALEQGDIPAGAADMDYSQSQRTHMLVLVLLVLVLLVIMALLSPCLARHFGHPMTVPFQGWSRILWWFTLAFSWGPILISHLLGPQEWSRHITDYCNICKYLFVCVSPLPWAVLVTDGALPTYRGKDWIVWLQQKLPVAKKQILCIGFILSTYKPVSDMLMSTQESQNEVLTITILQAVKLDFDLLAKVVGFLPMDPTKGVSAAMLIQLFRYFLAIGVIPHSDLPTDETEVKKLQRRKRAWFLHLGMNG